MIYLFLHTSKWFSSEQSVRKKWQRKAIATAIHYSILHCSLTFFLHTVKSATDIKRANYTTH